jgi:hypothetical protein
MTSVSVAATVCPPNVVRPTSPATAMPSDVVSVGDCAEANDV